MKTQLTNSEIAEIIELNGKLLDLHNIDGERAKVFISSVFALERFEGQISGMKPEELNQLGYYGRVLKDAIVEINATGSTAELEYLVSITPKGLFDILKVKGLGIKKVKILWNGLGIETLKSLKTACENHQIQALKGFGVKTEEAIYESILFIESMKGKLRLDAALQLSDEILHQLKIIFPESFATGAAVTYKNIIEKLSFLVIKEGFGGLNLPTELFIQDLKSSSPSIWRGRFIDFEIPIEVEKTTKRNYVSKSIMRSSTEQHLSFTNHQGETFLSFLDKNSFETEHEAYEKFGFPYIIPEMRNGRGEFERDLSTDEIITWNAIKGTVHNHSTYSDGKDTLEQMADACRKLGFQYFGIADHSQSATYAKGLLPDTVFKQHQEIDQLNAQYTDDFRILKGIEADILIDGNLDYADDILKNFDYVVASVHSVLNMDLDRATHRIIKAIENPYTTILGHPTGRLLLRREGYPIDYIKIIDACAANGVSMELNANPYRLDIDWTWLEYCMDKRVMVSINPDAHSTEGLLDMHYGVKIARKAGLLKSMVFNTLTLSEMLMILKK